MYTTGDFIEPVQPFNAEFWGPSTVQYMSYIANDLGEKHWNSIFLALNFFSARSQKEEDCQDMVFLNFYFDLFVAPPSLFMPLCLQLCRDYFPILRDPS